MRRNGYPLLQLVAAVFPIVLLVASRFPVAAGGQRGGRAAEERPAQRGGDGRPSGEVECRWTDLPVRIDGDAGEDAWRSAAVIDRFALPWLGAPARLAKAATRARLLWDRENLYFAADLDDADLFADVLEHDGMTWSNDVLELFFRPAEDKPGYYEFQVNAAGTVMDMFLPSRDGGGFDRFKGDGDFHLETKVALRGTLNQRDDRDRGWTVEGRIPWSDFLRTGGRPAIGERWRFALCRYDYTLNAEPELSTNAPLTKASFHRYEDYAVLRFSGPTSTGARPFGIDRRIPVTTSRVVGSPDPPPPYRARRVYPKLALNYPVAIAHEPGSDRLLAIVHKSPGGASSLMRFKDDPEVDSAETLLSVDRLEYDLTFHPNFAQNGYLYLGGKGPLAAERPNRKAGVTRFTMARRPPFALDPASLQTIIDWPSDGHDGAALAFGLDGMFYVTSGDGTSDSDDDIVGQDLTKLTAKVLRIDVDHPDPGRAYSVPKDNPFLNMPDARPETWAYGFRNPWRMTVDQKTGHLWVGMNGQDLWETAYLVERGANYGWSVYEGSHPFYETRKLGPTPVSPPTLEHPHSEARSLTGGIVYYGDRYPDLRGAYIYGDYSTGKIWGARHDGKKLLWHQEIADTSLQIAGFGTDSHGELLIVDIGADKQGGLYTLDPSPKEAGPNRFPRRLSESGLFKSVRGHVPQAGLIPYTVNAPLWSDGAYKERYLALPGEEQIAFDAARGWEFPEQTVMVKSFGLEMVEGNPASRRWIETRLFTQQEGEWVGYSYLWNDAQTDATLVESKGEDREFRVRVPRSEKYPDGFRKQVWRYPSRAECMVCHSRAANFVLGVNTAQLNRDHDYGPRRDNQLRVLEHLGVLKLNWAKETRDLLREEADAKGLSRKEADSLVNRQMNNSGQRRPAESTLLAQAPERYRHLADPYDAKQELTARVRAYLHSNCAQCHVSAGGGNSQIELDYLAKPEEMHLFDVKPLHDTFGLEDARLVAPGSPTRSVLLHRLTHRDKGHMPPLATAIVDHKAVALFEEWIRGIKPISGQP